MIQPNLPIPLAFHYRSHFLILLFHSSSRFAPWLPSPPLSPFPSLCLLCYLCIPLPCSFPPSIFVSLSHPRCSCLHFTLAPHSHFYHFLSNSHRPRGSGNGECRVLMLHAVTGIDIKGRKPCWTASQKFCTELSWVITIKKIKSLSKTVCVFCQEKRS